LKTTNQIDKGKNLILLTITFPYGKGETFLELEIKYLSAYFEKIIIFPSIKQEGSRALPPNVRIEDSFCEQHIDKTQRAVNLIKAIFYLFTKGWFLKEIITVCFSKIRSIKNLLTTFLYTKDGYQKAIILEKYIKKHKKDTKNTIFYSYWFMSSALAMGLYKKRNGSAITVTRAHQFDLYLDNITVLPLKKFTSDYTNVIVPISRNGADYLNKIYGINKSKLIVHNLGVESNQTTYRKKDVSRDTLVLLSCSFVNDRKRVGLISEALDIIAEKHSHVKLEWRHIGDGDQKKIDDILSKSKKYPSNIKVKFLGYFTNTAVIEYYDRTKDIDVFISTSALEGKPVSMMEAQSYGIPVIATDSGGISEIVNPENGSLLTNNATPSQIADAILSYFDDAVLEKKSIQSFKCWSEEYNAEKNYRTFAEFLLKLN
jgi:glycosyltransferase involved in cell wall biosynthesis